MLNNGLAEVAEAISRECDEETKKSIVRHIGSTLQDQVCLLCTCVCVRRVTPVAALSLPPGPRRAQAGVRGAAGSVSHHGDDDHNRLGAHSCGPPCPR